jgi:hypothetical protein
MLASFGWRYAPLLTVIFHGKEPAPIRRTGRMRLSEYCTGTVTKAQGEIQRRLINDGL